MSPPRKYALSVENCPKFTCGHRSQIIVYIFSKHILSQDMFIIHRIYQNGTIGIRHTILVGPRKLYRSAKEYTSKKIVTSVFIIVGFSSPTLQVIV